MRTTTWITSAAVLVALAASAWLVFHWRDREPQAQSMPAAATAIVTPQPDPSLAAEALLETARRDFEDGRYAESAAKQQRVIALLPEPGDPLRLDATLALGDSLLALGELDGATGEFHQVQQLWYARGEPGNIQALAAAAGILRARRRLGELRESLAGNRELEQGLKADDAGLRALRVAVLREQALAMLDLGQASRAARTIAQANKIDSEGAAPAAPPDPALALAEARIAMVRGRNDEAQALAAAASLALAATRPADHPQLAEAQVLLGRLLRLTGDATAAIGMQGSALQALSAALPDNHPARANAEMELGRSLLAAGEPDSAEPLLRASRARFAEYYGDAAWQTGEPELALADALAQLGHPEPAKAMRSGAATRLREQLPKYHPVLAEIRVRYR